MKFLIRFSAVAMIAAFFIGTDNICNGDSILVANPSFEDDPHPGGIGQLGAITGWTTTPGGKGVNTNAGPFSDNGLIPDRQQAFYLQGVGSLSQNLSGFDTSKQYWLQLYSNARDCCTVSPNPTPLAGASVSFAGTDLLLPLLSVSTAPVNPVEAAPNHTIEYGFVNIPFTPTAASGDLLFVFSSLVGGDHTVLIDGVSIIQRDADEVLIQNPSFEASGAGLPFPGYEGNIAGWTFTNNGGGNSGINTNPPGPFFDNGNTPDGQNVALIQQDATLSQMINDLTIGQQYELSYSYNARNGALPEMVVDIGGIAVETVSVTQVGAGNDFHSTTFQFIANATSMNLSFSQTIPFPTTDQTLLLDDISIRVVPEPASITLAVLAILGLAFFRRRRTV